MRVSICLIVTIVRCSAELAECPEKRVVKNGCTGQQAVPMSLLQMARNTTPDVLEDELDEDDVQTKAKRLDSPINPYLQKLYPSILRSRQWGSHLLKRASFSKSGFCGILWFYHVPKCGGTAVGTWLDDAASSGNIETVFPLMSMEEEVDYTAFHETNIEPFLDAPQGRVVAVHHHHRGPGVAQMNATFSDIQTRLRVSGCELLRFTFLRQPEERLISSLYFNNPDVPAADRPGVFRQWLEDNPNRTEQHYILDNKLGESYPTANNVSMTAALNILREFEYVGVSEDTSVGMDKVAAMAQMPTAPTMQQVNTNSHNAGEDLPKDLREYIAEYVKQDNPLYQEALVLVGAKAVA